MNTKLFLGTLIAASALSVPAWAESYSLSDGGELVGNDGSSAYTFAGDTITVSSGTITASNWGQTSSLGAWINFCYNDKRNIGGTLGSSTSGTTITGNGFLGLAVRYGGSSCTADLTNVTVSNFSGQLCVVNTYAKDVTVKLSGDQWSGTEYIFGTKTVEWSGATGTGSASVPYFRGIGGNDSTDTLALQGATTLAGITGTSKGYTSNGYSVNDLEKITVATSGDTLTIAGSGTYAFYGTVATSETRASLAMTGTGSQTFGGTNYLENVTVTAGTLALGGTTSITGSVSVADGATLDLSDGTVTLTNAISNSGYVIVNSDTIFVLSDSLITAENTYTIIDGGSITGWSDLDYTNFGLDSARQLTSSDNGTITVNWDGSAQSLTWNGSGSGTWNSGVDTNQVWTNSGTSSNDYFVNGDSVTFSTSGTNTITVSGAIHAGTMTVSSGDSYTFTNSTDSSLTVDSVSVTNSAKITFEGGGEFTITGDYSVTSNGDTYDASLAVGASTSVTMANYEANYHQGATTLGEGATLTVTTQMWFHTNNTEELTGTGGTFNIEQLTVSNYAVVYVHDTTLNIGYGNASRGGLKADDDGHFEFGDNLTVGVYAGESGTNTGWFTYDAIKFVGESNTGTTFYTNDGETITLGGALSGVGFTNSGDGTLTLSGTVSVSSAIINSGNIVLSNTVSIAVDNLEMQTYGEDEKTSYYEIITGSGGSVTFEGGSSSNFTLDGGTLSNSWSIWENGLTNGYLVIYRTANDLTWAGSDGNNTWGSSGGDSEWTGGTFANGDDVTFGTGATEKTVVITSNVAPGSITVQDNYTFTTNVTAGVTVDASGSLTVAAEKTLTINEGVTLYIDFEESSFSVEGKIAGEGTIEIDLNSGYNSTINLGSENDFAGTVYIHSGSFHLYGSDIGSGTYRLGNGVNIEIATSGVSVSNAFIIEGTTQLHVNANDSLTISGNITGEASTDEDSEPLTPTLDRHGAGSLTITGTVNIDTFIINTTGNADVSSTTTLSGSSTISTLNMAYANTLALSGSGTHAIGELLVNTTGTATLDYSGLESSGTLTIDKLDFATTGTIAIKGNASGTGTITTVDFNYAGTLAITEGIVNVVSLTDTYTSNAHAATVTIAAGSILSVDSMSFATGQAGTYCSSFSGAEEGGAGTLIVGSLTIGNDSTGAATEIKDVTFISGSGGISFGTAGNGSNYYLFLDNVTWGFTGESTTIAAATGTSDNGVIELGDKGSGLTTTTEATKTTINTNKYSTDSNTFTDEGVTVTIAAVIAGSGTLAVTGNGSLTLSGENTFTGGLTIDAGYVIANNNSALGSGSVTIENGGQLEVSGSVEISNNINIVLSEANISGNAATPTSLVVTLASTSATDVYALIGSGTISSATITITVDSAVAELLAAGGTYTFDIYDTTSGLSLGTSINWVLNDLTQYGYEWNGDTGQLILRGLPEPELFSIFFGLGALGLVGIRRRRR